MIKLAFLLFCFSVINPQEQNEIIQQDNTQEEIINRISVSDSLQIEGVPDSLNQIKPLPEVRKLDTELKKLEPGEDFFEFKSFISLTQQNKLLIPRPRLCVKSRATYSNIINSIII